MTITLGSLFDGIGVFPLAASRHGITPVWASEIIPDAISIRNEGCQWRAVSSYRCLGKRRWSYAIKR